ncbi:ABC transporter ATP-binding protein [Mycoplasma phocimorsus]|uniref:ABC transporter ATP-binding protein n=1 Tax=Mycoplasma phocimorsus TaxID=3045839 RepID=UPI0024C0BB1B|nr:ABC transporter ATP-binding protein [Mycoplasma phocimorsus]MDJ1647973.1 ABC transporter ATP-binding protein [Mycoplasma phocimorsus]
MKKNKSIIELVDVVKEFENKKVLKSINLDIKKGDFVTLLGPSGSGKTTILRLIAGFEWATRGEILFNNKDIKDLEPHKRDLSTIFQDYALFPHLNVESNIMYGLHLKRIFKENISQNVKDKLEYNKKQWTKKATLKMKELDLLIEKLETAQSFVEEGSPKYHRLQNKLDDIDFKYSYWETYVDLKTKNFENIHLKRKLTKEEIKEKITKMINLVGLQGNEKAFISELSGGMRQRVALARSLVIEPSILLLDEPLSALDAKIRVKMQVLLKNIQKELKLTFIFITHDQDEALELSDKVAIIRDGRIEQYDSPKNIYDYPINKWVAEFIGDSNIMNGRFLGNKLVEINKHQFKTIHNEFKENEEVDVLIRPEDIDIHEHRGKLKGKVIKNIYRGSYYFTTVEISKDFIMYVETTKHYEVGTIIFLDWTLDSIHLMKKEKKDEREN